MRLRDRAMSDQKRHLSYMEERNGMSVEDVEHLVRHCLELDTLEEMRAWTFTVTRYNVLEGGVEYKVKAEGKR